MNKTSPSLADKHKRCKIWLHEMGFILVDFSALNRSFKAFEDQLKRIYHLSVWVYFSELSLFNSVSHSVCAISRRVDCKKKLYKTLIKVCVVFFKLNSFSFFNYIS